jgi:hypothetical protein
MKNDIKNKEGGFIKLIIFIVIALFLMKYFKISLSDVIDWIKSIV